MAKDWQMLLKHEGWHSLLELCSERDWALLAGEVQPCWPQVGSCWPLARLAGLLGLIPALL